MKRRSTMLLLGALSALWMVPVPHAPAQAPTEEELKDFERQAEQLEKKQAAAKAEAKRKAEAAKKAAAAAEAKRKAEAAREATAAAEAERKPRREQTEEERRAAEEACAGVLSKWDVPPRPAEDCARAILPYALALSARRESDGRERATEAGIRPRNNGL